MSRLDPRQSIPGLPGKISGRAARRLPATRTGWLARLAPIALLSALLVTAAVAPGAAVAPEAAAAPNYRPVDLGASVQTQAQAVEKASMVLAISGSSVAANAQYRMDPAIFTDHKDDSSYANTNEYIGYFNSDGCYKYLNGPPEPALDVPGRDRGWKRFYLSGPATDRKCVEAFSGNFLNWASSSVIDTVRLALTGGDRYIDTPPVRDSNRHISSDGLTVLQRAVLPGAWRRPERCIWNTREFPRKTLMRDGGGSRTYWGAVPLSMITADMDRNGGNIYISNWADQIWFGTEPGLEDCNSRQDTHTLGAWNGPRRMDPATDVSDANPPADAFVCSDGEQRDNCNFSGPRQVWFGRSWKWRVATAVNGVDCRHASFGISDPAAWGPGRCYLAPYRGPGIAHSDWHWSMALPPGVFNSDGFFFARVQVCDSSSTGVERVLEDVRSYPFCERYPNGDPKGGFKPAGLIQKYSDQMRLAAFGHMLGAAPRFGGLLRVPMKFVGQKTYGSNGQAKAGANPRAEWDAQTGVLIADPDAADRDRIGDVGVSGLINYVNQLGRTRWQGLYADPHPAGELHYEALRYLQGLGPSQAAIADLEGNGPGWSDLRDGFPFWTRRSDPYDSVPGDAEEKRSSRNNYACLKSNILLISDSTAEDHGHGDLPAANPARNVPDLAGARNIVLNFERQDRSGALYTDGAGKLRPIVNPNPANPIAPALREKSLMMGTAYWARTHDIRGLAWADQPERQRPGLRVKTLVYDLNWLGHEKHADDRRHNRQLFMAAKYGGFETDPKNPDGRPYNNRGNPFYDLRGAVAENENGRADNRVWEKADQPGEAASYYFYDGSNPNDARKMRAAFDQIFRQNMNAPRSVGAAMSPGAALIANARLYKASFDPENWSGDIQAWPLERQASAGADASVAIGEPLWKAADRLDAMDSNQRNIYMGTGPGRLPIELRWPKIEAAPNAHELVPYFSKARASDALDGFGADRIAFLRGERRLEGDRFRARKSRLGDIVHSNISYSGLPRRRHEGSGYQAFYREYAQRRPVIFAGANDGMLHAFDAASGNEVFAYIPSWIVPRLAALTHPGYANAHQNHVDGLSVVSEARTSDRDEHISDWKTVLVSGTGAGGSGVFALDVTDPTKFDADKLLWEFTSINDSALGQVVGAPKIMKIKISGHDPVAKYRWFAVVASGVNNYVAERPRGPFSTTGKPAIFLLALDKRRNDEWVEGRNYYKIEMPVLAAPAPGQQDADGQPITGKPSGIIDFSALYGSAGEMTDLYFGDLHGQVWRLNFSDKKPESDGSGWTLDKLSFFKTPGGQPRPLYVARSGSGVVQPISAAPALFVGPRVGGRETFYLLFGTGKYLEPADLRNTETQSVYAIFDNGDRDGKTHGSDQAGAGAPARVIAGRHMLQQASVNATTRRLSVPAFTWGYPQNRGSPERAGWFFDLPAGEQVDLAAEDLGALTAALNSKTSAAAQQPNAGGGCPEPGSGGGGNQYVLNVNTGEAQYAASEVGLLGAPLFLSTSADSVVGAADSAGRYIVTKTYHRIQSGSDGVQAYGSDGANSAVMKPNPRMVAGTLSWRRIFNYQELKNAPPTRPAAPASGAAQ